MRAILSLFFASILVNIVLLDLNLLLLFDSNLCVGASQMRLGYVSRVRARDPNAHTILVQTRREPNRRCCKSFNDLFA